MNAGKARPVMLRSGDSGRHRGSGRRGRSAASTKGCWRFTCTQSAQAALLPKESMSLPFSALHPAPPELSRGSITSFYPKKTRVFFTFVTMLHGGQDLPACTLALDGSCSSSLGRSSNQCEQVGAERRRRQGLGGVSPVGRFHCKLSHSAVPIKLMIIIMTV